MAASAGRTLRILIADDDPLARGVLTRALHDGGVTVAAVAASAAEAVELAAKHRPDVILMDSALGEQGSVAAIPAVLARAPDSRVLVLTNSMEANVAVQNLRCGASGYLTKDLDMSALPRIILGIAAGEAAVSRELTMELIDRLRLLPDSEVGTRPVKSGLTPREWEVLDLLCLGHSTSSMAEELFVTHETVRSHVKNIVRKLGLSSRADAVQAAPLLRRSGRIPQAQGAHRAA